MREVTDGYTSKRVQNIAKGWKIIFTIFYYYF